MRWPAVIATSALEGPGLSELYQRWLVMSLVPVAYVMYACCMHTHAHLPCPVLILHGEHPCLNYDACNRRLWPCLYAHLKPRESNFPARIAEASLLHDVECRLGLSTKVLTTLMSDCVLTQDRTEWRIMQERCENCQPHCPVVGQSGTSLC